MSEKLIRKEINAWEKDISYYQPNDFEMVYDGWVNQTFQRLDPEIQSKFFSKLDDFLFHTHAYLQGSPLQMDTRAAIINNGRVFKSSLEEIQDLKACSIDELTYLAQQHISKGKLYSFLQGGFTGAGGPLLLGFDFPLMVIMNLRVVQQIGLAFGHEMNHPYEMMLSLKVFHAATLPKRFQYQAWTQLMHEIKSDNVYLYEGNDNVTDPSWMDQPLKQTFKALLILMWKRKLVQGIPVLSIGVGAYFNYHLTRQVSQYALRFYQKRYLIDKQKEE
ncbi:EcsC family protein [Aquibacillus sediminis]|uniref:EcsC family protein n=1 Tax=Aquibacillus sediminis TaxID=2574734 RepID=UPI001109E815|nr:EcsC family protein [Aquibacillus sediminis]